MPATGINSAHLQCLYASSPLQTQSRGPSRQESVATPFLGLIKGGLHSQPTTTWGQGSGSHQSLGPAHLPSRSHPLPGPGIGLLSSWLQPQGFLYPLPLPACPPRESTSSSKARPQPLAPLGLCTVFTLNTLDNKYGGFLFSYIHTNNKFSNSLETS